MFKTAKNAISRRKSFDLFDFTSFFIWTFLNFLAQSELFKILHDDILYSNFLVAEMRSRGAINNRLPLNHVVPRNLALIHQQRPQQPPLRRRDYKHLQATSMAQSYLT